MISIVVPIYNGEKYIEDCIRSILFQTYSDWELILIDNASTDDSLQICKEYATKDDRIEVFHQHHNMGVSAARNLGIEKSRGDYITFIDIDDWVKTDYLDKLSAIQQKKNADMVICGYQKACDKDRVVLKSGTQKRTNDVNEEIDKGPKCQLKVYETKDYLEKYFLEGNTHCWGVLFKRELLYGIYFPKGMSIGEDMLFLLDIAERTRTIVVTNYKGYHYYINEGGAMNKKFTPSYMDQIYCWEKALQKIAVTYPELITKVESIIVVSVLLVVGKLSELDSAQRNEFLDNETECYETFLKYVKKKEIKNFLPTGYPLKVLLYQHFPKGYIQLYGRLKK